MSSLLLASLSLTLSTGAAQIDAEAVVRESVARLQSARTVRGAYTAVNSAGISRVEFALEKPYQLSLRSASRIDVFNGREHVIASTKDGTYEVQAPEVYGTPYLIGFTDFLENTPDRRLVRPTFSAPTVVAVEGRSYVRRSTGSGESAMSYDIDPSTKLPARWTWRTGGREYVARFEDVVLDGAVDSSLFDVAAVRNGRTEVPTRQEAALPVEGSTAPAIEGAALTKRSFALGAYAAERKATVLAFLDANSLGSANALTALGDLLRKNAYREVGVVAVVRSGDERATRTFVRKFGAEPTTLYGATADAAFSSYRVALVPTFVVVNPSGAVIGKSIGYDEADLNSVLAAASSR